MKKKDFELSFKLNSAQGHILVSFIKIDFKTNIKSSDYKIPTAQQPERFSPLTWHLPLPAHSPYTTKAMARAKPTHHRRIKNKHTFR
jgi:hypothetical protein